jgi:hypothetical protein
MIQGFKRLPVVILGAAAIACSSSKETTDSSRAAHRQDIDCEHYPELWEPDPTGEFANGNIEAMLVDDGSPVDIGEWVRESCSAPSPECDYFREMGATRDPLYDLPAYRAWTVVKAYADGAFHCKVSADWFLMTHAFEREEDRKISEEICLRHPDAPVSCMMQGRSHFPRRTVWTRNGANFQHAVDINQRSWDGELLTLADPRSPPARELQLPPRDEDGNPLPIRVIGPRF